ncbi:Aspartic peptidase [Parasponia andersonii]|uniref:Aspartic peptidase n=1 Tax=Parasponia andersonii TaxID=3476 RepID=A0A2P5C6N8_PARAD|nr:Aspartic peptidase [Parasponia andersonii]
MLAIFRNQSPIFSKLLLDIINLVLLVSLPIFASDAQGTTINNDGVSISLELIHRDSPKSPLYSPSQTHWERLAKVLNRSNHRANDLFMRHQNCNYHSPSKIINLNGVQSDIISSKGEYLMSISIGTPPISFIGIADTGSDLIWTQCKPCLGCFSQRDPFFDSATSSTYEVLPCKSKECKYLTSTSCYPKNSCFYVYAYGDKSFTKGNLSLETLTLSSSAGPNKPVSFPRTIFGCGHQDGGLFTGIESGIIGLGSGKLSLVSQMGSSMNRKFSYCLVPISSSSDLSSKINFGSKGLSSGPGVVTTPLLSKASKSFYYLVLQGISVDNKRLFFTSTNALSSSSRTNFWGSFKGNIIIDTGATLSYLPSNLYYQLESAMRKAVGLPEIKDPTKVLSLCYNTNQSDVGNLLPTVTFHFKGADLNLKAFNTFLRIKQDILCLAFLKTEGIAVFGNVAQMNHLVEYDLKRKVVSFKPTDCTK